MEQLTALGTGYAVATKCYTTCFTISDGQEHFMIDTGGGSGVLTNLEKLGISVNQVHHIFLSHCHTDHVLGAVWMLRMIGHSMQRGSYQGTLHLYCHQDIADGCGRCANLCCRADYCRCLANASSFIAWPTGSPLIFWAARLSFLTPAAKRPNSLACSCNY